MEPSQQGNDSHSTPDFLEQRFRGLVESLQDYAVFLIDINGTITSWNPGVEAVLGYAESAFVGLPFASLFTPADIASGQPAQELARAVATGRSDDKREHVRKDGRWFRADGVVTVIRNAEGTPQAFSKVMHDVTVAHTAAEALRDSEERYRMLVDNVRDYAIFMLDAGGHVTMWTEAAERMKGYRAAEIVGQHFRVFFTAEDQARGLPELELQRAVTHGRGDGEGWRVRKDGSRFWGDEVITAIGAGSGLRGFAKVVRDLTARQQAALEREHLLSQAQQANRLKDEFLGTISHELRTPLNAILGWAQLLGTDGLTLDVAKQRRAIEAIVRNARVQVQLVDDLLDVSRIISGKMRLQIRPTPLGTVLQAAAESVQPAAQAKGVELRLRLDPEIAMVPADGDRLQQIVWNLLANAIKFTPPGGMVTLQTRLSDAGTDIIVTDTGSGISPELLPFIFERFRTGDSSTTRQHGGVGLGLAIVRHLVELHGGRVEAASAGAGHGTTFTVSLPGTALTVPGNVPEYQVPIGTVGAPLPTLTNIRVLVVDDNEDTRELLTTVLSQAGADVSAAESAARALALLEQRPPDVIVADIGMPDQDGYAFIAHVRRNIPDPIRATPAIALTAYVRAEDRERALAAGYHLHIAKPFEPRAIIEAVSRVRRLSS